MSRRHSPWPDGTPCWLDLASSDLAGVKEMYAEVFGWELIDSGPDYGGYINARKDGSQAAGLASTMGPEQPDAWMVYLASGDVDATAAAITSAGGHLVFGPMDVPGVGRLVIALDPGGVVFGLWQHGSHIGAELVNEPGGLIWEHLNTPDVEAAKAFYGSVFGWVFEPMGGPGDGHTFAAAPGRPPLGSVSDMGPDAPRIWVPFLCTEDADRAAELVGSAGGRVVLAAQDTPFGRMAALADATGALFNVLAPGDRPQPDWSG